MRALAGPLGGVDRLVAILENLQVPLAVVREELGVDGLGTEVATNFRDKAQMKTVFEQAGVPCARGTAGSTTPPVRWRSRRRSGSRSW